MLQAQQCCGIRHNGKDGDIQPGSVKAGDEVPPEYGSTKVVSYLAMMTFLENMWPEVTAEMVSHEAVHPPEALNVSSCK